MLTETVLFTREIGVAIDEDIKIAVVKFMRGSKYLYKDCIGMYRVPVLCCSRELEEIMKKMRSCRSNK